MRRHLSGAILLSAIAAFAFRQTAVFAEDTEAKPAVSVEKNAATVERRVFVPWNHFGPRPKLDPGQKALTEFFFKLGVGADDVEITRQEERHGRWFVQVRPSRFVVRLSLPIIIWLPQGAPQKCIRHEEGHRRIAERIYEFADDIVRHYAEEILSRSFYGEGGTIEQAIKDGYDRAILQLNDSYRETVLAYAKLVTVEYDRITEHGLNPISEDQAIEQSFQTCSSKMAHLLEERQTSRSDQMRKKVEGPVTRLDDSSQQASKSDTTNGAAKSP